jgi:hypothetical protein
MRLDSCCITAVAAAWSPAAPSEALLPPQQPDLLDCG